MRLLYTLVAFTAAMLTENGVVVLKQDTFDDFISPDNNYITMIEFYAPWCGHCKTFAPVYEEVAAELAAHDPPIRVAKVDATEPEMKQFAERYGVTGYPTLKMVRDGEVTDWSGGRDKPEIVEKLLQLSDPNWAPPPEAVVSLTSDNFDEIVNAADFMVVEFFTPWCGHCKKLAPEWELAAQDLKKEGIILAKVDATEQADLATRFEVTGYPTLKVFRRGTPYEYNGGRDRHTIVSYVLDQAGPPSLHLNTKKSHEKVIKYGSKKGPGVPVIGYFTDENDPRLIKFADAANHLREEFQFHHVYGSDVAAYGGKVGILRVVQPPHFQSKYENKHLDITIEDETTSEELKHFTEEHVLPLVGAVTAATKKYYEPIVPRCLVFFDVDFSHVGIKNTQIWRNKVLNVAYNKRESGIIFAVADETENLDLLKRFNLQDSGEEINVGCVGKDKMFYPMPEDDFDEDVLEDFVDAVIAGKAKPYIKSEKVPKVQKGVVKVVGNNFKQIVEDDSKDVLIEFYAPWCGHCKSLVPIYDELAASFKDDANVVIAKMDATANDIPSPLYEAAGFPTIYFKPAGASEPMKYEAGRALSDFENFIETNSGLATKDEL